MLNAFRRKWGNDLTLILSLMFLVIANIPGTVALRYALLACSLMMVAVQHPSVKTIWREQQWPVLTLGCFMAYAALHCGLFALWPSYAWAEFRNQLLIGALWFVVGLVLFRVRRSLSILDLVIIAGAILAVAEFAAEAWEWHVTGLWPYMKTFTMSTHLEFTFFMNLVLAFVLVPLCFGHRTSVQATKLPRWSLLLIAALVVFLSLRVAARNGMIGLIYLSLSLFVVFLFFEGRKLEQKKVLALLLIVPILLAGLAGYSYKKDTRNQQFIGSVEEGWHYDRTDAWRLEHPLPLIGNGMRADESAYRRVAWIHSGLKLIYAHPLGYGYGRGAFTRALTSQGYVNQVGHSHSGFIDLGVGLGVPGILLWFAYCLALILIGLRAFTRRGEMLGLVLMLVSCGFIGRMLIESIQRDHMLYLFLFVSAALLAEMQLTGANPAFKASDSSRERDELYDKAVCMHR